MLCIHFGNDDLLLSLISFYHLVCWHSLKGEVVLNVLIFEGHRFDHHILRAALRLTGTHIWITFSFDGFLDH